MSFDLNELSPEEIIELAADLFEDGMEKEASDEDGLPYGFDLNELDVDEFLEFADAVADEMEGMDKEAARSYAHRAKRARQWMMARAKVTPGRVKKHYKGRAADAAQRGSIYGPHQKGKEPGKIRRGARKAWAYGTEFAPEGVAAGGAAGAAAHLRSRRKKNRS